MVKNYFLNVLAGIAPFGLLVSLSTVQIHRNTPQNLRAGLRI